MPVTTAVLKSDLPRSVRYSIAHIPPKISQEESQCLEANQTLFEFVDSSDLWLQLVQNAQSFLVKPVQRKSVCLLTQSTCEIMHR